MIVTRAGAALGAVVTELDLRQPMSSDQQATLNRALLDHLLLIFPNQKLSPEEMMSFARSWGELMVHPNLKPTDIHPALIAIERRPGDLRYTGSQWHSDATHMKTPPKLTLMYSKVVPPVGGETMFANQYLAYESLSTGMKAMLDPLEAVHSDERVAGPKAGLNALRTTKTNESADWRPTRNRHPVVRVHPEAGRPALYVNVASTTRLADMTEEESAPLLGFLFEINHQLEFTYRHRWEADMLVIWDNRALVHVALNDCPDDHRLMHRLQIVGDRPIGRH